VLAVARGDGGEDDGELDFLGLLGLADPPRPEAIAAVQAARGAGIRTVMITGDHPVTARAIATELGILGPDDEPEEVVHARVTPEDKLTIVREWKERGAIVAMTGDGVNDAPAIREAHIGIAMGITGTEVTREASSVVLTDDNFASIVEGVREGRTIHDNIRKTLVYLLSGNAAELLLMFGASLVGLPMPLIPLHLLWINLVTDGLPALALVTDPPDADTMRRQPRAPDEPMLAGPQWGRVLFTGLVEGLLVLGVFAFTHDRYGLDFARDMAFTTLVFSELLRAFAARSTERVIWEVGPFSNLWLLGVVVLSGVVQIGLHHLTATSALFHLADMGLRELAVALALGFVPVTVLEIAKLVRRAA
jgi:Ca2+-transporting ATPase